MQNLNWNLNENLSKISSQIQVSVGVNLEWNFVTNSSLCNFASNPIWSELWSWIVIRSNVNFKRKLKLHQGNFEKILFYEKFWRKLNFDWNFELYLLYKIKFQRKFISIKKLKFVWKSISNYFLVKF